MTTARASLDEVAPIPLDAWRALAGRTRSAAHALGRPRATGPIHGRPGKEPSMCLGLADRKMSARGEKRPPVGCVAKNFLNPWEISIEKEV